MTSFRDVVMRLQKGDVDAPKALERLANSGDAEALYMLGEFRLTGAYGALDPKAGYRMIAQAAVAGHPDARRTHAYLTEAGMGCEADPVMARELLKSAAQNDRFAHAQLLLDGEFAKEEPIGAREMLHDEPLIFAVRGFLNANQCKYVQHVARPWLAPARIVHPVTGEPMPDPVRRSDTMNFGPVFEDFIIQRINRRIAEATDSPRENGEPLSVLRYGPGQEYRPHLDAFDQAEPSKQRALTALIWLNEDFEGGSTFFPQLSVDFRGDIGDLLVFQNVDADGKCDRRTVHAGTPVSSGEKWLASRWIRDGAFFT